MSEETGGGREPAKLSLLLFCYLLFATGILGSVGAGVASGVGLFLVLGREQMGSLTGVYALVVGLTVTTGLLSGVSSSIARLAVWLDED